MLDFLGLKNSFTTPEIITQCKKLKNISQLQYLGSFMTLGSELSTSDLQKILSKSTLDKMEKHQIVMLILLIPASFSPKELFEAFESIIEIINQLPSRMQTGLAMKWVRTAVLAGRLPEFYDSSIIHEFFKANPDLYSAPYLYLCSAYDKPVSIEVSLSGDVRINAEAYYYSAINKMLLSDYNNAEIDLIRALTLSKKCSDMKDSILSKLSLCSFLNRTPECVFRGRVPTGRVLPRVVDEIWNFEKPLDTSLFPPFYKRFTQEIVYEHARCVLLNLASTVTVMKLEDVQELIGECEVEMIAEVLKAEESLMVTIKDGCIYFNDSSKSDLLNIKIQEVQQLMQSLS